MNLKTKDRIKNEAKKFADCDTYIYNAYIAGATSEHPKAWNEAIEKVLFELKNYNGAFTSYGHYQSLKELLESLKL